MKIIGIDKRYKDVYLAYINYAATGEGVMIEAQICDNKGPEPKIGDPVAFPPDKIPAVVEKKFQNQTYLDWNPEFEAKFLKIFGVETWNHFINCLEQGGWFQLTYKLHYNLS